MDESAHAQNGAIKSKRTRGIFGGIAGTFSENHGTMNTRNRNREQNFIPAKTLLYSYYHRHGRKASKIFRGGQV